MISDRIEANISRIPFSGCWIWMKSVGSHGYGQMMFADHKPRLVHRLSYEAHVGAIPPGKHVLHKCDVRSCCNPSHLFIGTAKDNMQDCKNKGRASKPPVGRNVKLTAEQRIEIGDRYRKGEASKALALEFRIHRSRVIQLVRGM